MEHVCSPCPEVECAEVTEDETTALKTLYKRITEKPADDAERDSTVKGCVGGPRLPKPLEKSVACREKQKVSVLKRFDDLIESELESRVDTSDLARDAAAVPDPILFKKCRDKPPGAHNSTLYGMDVEKAVVGPPAERDEMLDAIESLLKAEAACKYSGAVRAAEVAAIAQPEAKHAEDAARIGAKKYTAVQGAKSDGVMAETPVEVVGYVGCTRPPPVVVKANETKCPKAS